LGSGAYLVASGGRKAALPRPTRRRSLERCHSRPVGGRAWGDASGASYRVLCRSMPFRAPPRRLRPPEGKLPQRTRAVWRAASRLCARRLRTEWFPDGQAFLCHTPQRERTQRPPLLWRAPGTRVIVRLHRRHPRRLPRPARRTSVLARHSWRPSDWLGAVVWMECAVVC
jgi:hypothetical protein